MTCRGEGAESASLPSLFRGKLRGPPIRTIGVIPARYQATRFPGKLLADLGGRPVLLHVLDRARKAGLDRVVVATDDSRIEDIVRAAGGDVVRFIGNFLSGTDRIAAALPLIAAPEDDPADVIVNIQGDEPFIEPELISGVAGVLRDNPTIEMATAAAPAGESDRDNPGVVKTVLDLEGMALYFSRAGIPGRGAVSDTLRHVGIYAYRRGLVERFVRWSPGRLEKIESLEQLRALENGVRIRVLVRPTLSIGIDTPEDLERARSRWKAGS